MVSIEDRKEKRALKVDVAIIGAGPAGTATALFLQQRGIKPVLIEKELFPRFHIGESLTGETANFLQELGLKEEMDIHGHPVKYGVKVYGPDGKGVFQIPVMARLPEKGLREATTWQVRRSDFDEMLLNAALARGAKFIHGQALKPLPDNEGAVHNLLIRNSEGEIEEVETSVLIDASGRTTFLSNNGVLGRTERGSYDKQIAFFSHVKGAVRDVGKDSSATLIFYQKTNHWAWFIPLDQEVVSIGVVVPATYFQDRKETKEFFFNRELHTINPNLSERICQIEIVEEVRAISNYSYHIRGFTGKSYLCVGDSHRFIDPIFSFGVHIAFHEAYKAAEVIEKYLQGTFRNQANPFIDYQKYCEKGADAFQEIIDGFWANPLAFAFLAHKRYTEDFIDLFSGRVYNDASYHGLEALRELNAHNHQRTYIGDRA